MLVFSTDRRGVGYMAAAVDWKELLTAVLGVFVAIASLLLIAWMFNKGTDKTQQSPRIRKGFFLGVAALYALWMMISIVKVILGKESIEVLWGLPGGIFLLWLFAKAAYKVRTPS
jgi:hypothetical protein